MEGRPGNLEYWHAAYEEYGPPVLAFLVNRLGHRADAEDLLQETFVRAIHSRKALRDETKVKSYLFSIAHNLMINHVRKLQPDSASSLASPDGTNPLDRIADEGIISPELEAEANDLNGAVQAVLDTLHERYQVAFRLGVLEGRAYSDIARTTGWNLAQVKINVHRARRKVIDHLKDRGFLDVEMEP
jgi:RNA polymerase sigma-70 factor (ECF subfamily)